MRSKREVWPTEAAMFESFIAYVRPLGLTPYPETCGHDLVLLATEALNRTMVPGLEPGDTIVVEGKLRATLELLYQALPPHLRVREGKRGADFYAVLTPGCGETFREIASQLGIVAIDWTRDGVERAERYRRLDLGTQLPTFSDRFRVLDVEPHRLLLQVEQAAGRPAPRKVTRWKVEAVRLCMDHGTGEFRKEAFTDAVRPRTFLQRGWVRVVRREGRASVFELVDHPGRPDRVYPEIVAAILAARTTGDGSVIVEPG